MKQLVVKGLALLIAVTPILFLWTTIQASSLIDNAKSPFIDKSDPGAANDVAVIGTDTQQQDGIVNVVRWVINWVLWIMGLVALMFLIYGWFLMVTSWWEEDKYAKWFTILKHAVVWLILIGTAWFVASLIFWLINVAGKPAQWAAWTQS